MDSKLVLVIIIAIAASGCTDSGKSSGTGVQIAEFSAADTTLNPRQETSIEATIVNHNTGSTTITSENITLFNTGQLQVIKGSKECNPDEINAAQEGFNPKIRCIWKVKSPGKGFVEGFSSKPLSIKLQLKYRTSISNQKPLKIDFQELSNIEKSSEISQTASNGDVKLTVTSESPAATGNSQNLEVKAVNTGPGDIVGKYKFQYTPEEIFKDCPTSQSPIQGEVKFSCGMKSSSTGVRNVFVSTSYKYKKSPNLDIKVVNN